MKNMENGFRNEYVKSITNKYVAFAILIVVLLILRYRVYDRIVLEFNQTKWSSQNISHYRYQLKIVCMCNGGPVTIEVLDGQVISMVGADGAVLDLVSNRTVINKKNGTVAALFDIIQEETAKAIMIRTKYDSKYGFPILIMIDPSSWIDDERIYVISNFEVLP